MPITLTSDWDSQMVLSIAKNMPSDKAKKWETQAGHMFFKHRRATYHRACIEKCYTKMIEEMQGCFKEKQIEEGVHSSYAGPLAEVLLFHLDGFFEAERSGHDFVMNCLSTAGLLKKPPSSFNTFYKNKTKNPNAYLSDPPDLSPVLMEFWQDIGLRTRDYRDCLTHYLSLGGPTWQHAVNMKWSKELWTATFHLPDNPEANSYSSLTFDSNLDALGVCTHLNQETNSFLKKLMDACGKKWGANTYAGQDAQITLHNIHFGD